METTTQIYLEITLEDGQRVLGEARAIGYENQIDIDSFQFATGTQKNSLKDVQDKKVTNNLDIKTVSLSKVFDRSSLYLAGVMSRRQRFKEAKISVDQQYIYSDHGGKIRNEILVLTLFKGYVADIKLRTSEGDVGAEIKEDIELSFHNFDILYYAYKGEKQVKLGNDYRTEPHYYKTERKEQES